MASHVLAGAPPAVDKSGTAHPMAGRLARPETRHVICPTEPPRRRKSLLMQAFAANLLVLVAGLFCGTALVLWKQRSSFTEQLELRAAASAGFLASQSEYPLMVGDQEELQRLADAAVK